MDVQQALDCIHQTSWQNQTPGLERMTVLLEHLGNPQKKLKFVHVAGTNGKGSTCACIASILQVAGFKVGLNTSPYIHRFNERMQVNGAQISDQDLCSTVEQVRAVVETLPFRPTEFEWITALAMVYFLAQECHIVVLEVGLGGALDASNVIDCPEVAVITALGLDHTAILGNTLAEVATAKAGIIKPGGSVVTYGQCPEAEAVLAQQVSAQQAQRFPVDWSRLQGVGGELLRPSVTIAPYGELALGLAGSYQPNNALTAVTAVEVLAQKGWHITPEHMAKGLAQVGWMGRFEVLSHDPLVIFDGAHNPQGMAAVGQSVAQYFTAPPTLVLGVLEDKDVSAMLTILAGFCGKVFTVTPPSPRAMAADVLAHKLTTLGVEAVSCDSVKTAMERAGAENTPVIAMGSLYLCDPVRQVVCVHGNP